MKYLIVLFCAFVAYNEALITSSEQNAAVNQCVSQTGVSAKTIKKLTKKLQVPKNDPTLKPFLVCFFKQTGVQDDDGNIQFEKIREQLKNDFAKIDTDKLIDKCKNHVGDTAEENAYLATQCIVKNIKKLSQPGGGKTKRTE